LGQLIRFPIERRVDQPVPAVAQGPQALPALTDHDIAHEMAVAGGDESLQLALVALDQPCDRTFGEALSLLAIARLSATAAAFRTIEVALIERLLSRSLCPGRRERIAEAFASLLGRPELNALLVPHLASDDAITRRVVAAALGAPDNREAFDALTGVLNDADADVTVAAVAALANIGHPRTIDVFRTVLAACPPRPLRLAILRRLRALPPSASEQTAIEHLTDADPEVRLAAAMALDPPVSREAWAAAHALARDGDARVRVLAVALIEQDRAAVAIEAIAPLVDDRSPRVRRVAADAVRRLAHARRAEG
jgi:HEAT repeat protein